MTSNRSLTHYLHVSQALVSFLINALIALVTSLPRLLYMSGGQKSILMEVVTRSEIRSEIVGASFFLPFLTCMICTPLVWRDVRHGRISGRASSCGSSFRNPWDGTRKSGIQRILVRGAICGACGLLVVGLPFTKIIEACLPDAVMTRILLIVAKTLFLAGAGAIVTPLIALRALADCCSDSSTYGPDPS